MIYQNICQHSKHLQPDILSSKSIHPLSLQDQLWRFDMTTYTITCLIGNSYLNTTHLLSPGLLCLRELLRHTSTGPHQRREPAGHLPGAPQPAQKLPHTQQITQQPGEGCGGGREQRGRLGTVGQVSLKLFCVTSMCEQGHDCRCDGKKKQEMSSC